MNYARVVFPLPQDLSFSYAIPNHLASIVQPGARVLASLGRSVREGVVVGLMEQPELPDSSIEIKPLVDCLDDSPTFSDELLALTKWIAEYYLSSWGEALKSAIPAAVRTQQRRVVHLLATDKQIEVMKKRMPLQTRILSILRQDGDLSPNQLSRRIGRGYSKLRPVISTLQEKGLVELKSDFQSKSKPYTTLVASLAKPLSELETEIPKLAKRAPKQAQILEFLIAQSRNSENLDWSTSDLIKHANTGLMTLRALERKGMIHITSVQVVRNPLSLEAVPSTQPLTLNTNQARALDAIQAAMNQNRRDTFLLHGVTGSGKTEIYMQAIAIALKQGNGTIVLVPEIALTPQTISRIVGRFGARVAVLHSNLSDGERYDQWQRIRTGDAEIVVGPRSAIFAPMPNLGLIVVDEEHETSYKQADASPRYHARDVALKRSELVDCPVILGTATPSLESFYRAQAGEYHLLSLPSRVSNIKMPPVQIVDMREELEKSNRTIFSVPLRSAIENRLSQQEQVILFLNRRGFSTYVFCRACGHVERCNDCSISLTFHLHTKRMVCHHCNYERPTPVGCPQCGSIYFRYFGLGTQQVEQQAIKAFPKATIKRMDTDSTTHKDAHRKILDAFRTGEIDILVGTQMIAKGLDFPNVTLVGVISADTTLNLPDFRAGERAFSLLAQVAGRSGRSQAGGEVIIQTYMPEHYSIQASQEHDYLRFYRQEIGYREEFLYPPFSHAVTIVLRGAVEKEVIHVANYLLNCLEKLQAERFSDVEIRGPVAAPLSKIMGKFRWHFLLRGKHVEKLRELIRRAVETLPSAVSTKNVDLIVDIDPITVL
jgi:primosomal protein N' (replication factor Y)